MAKVEKWERMKRFLFDFFVAENSLEPKLQLLSQITENLVYVSIINGINYDQLLGVYAQDPTIFVVLIVLCLIKHCLKVSLRFGIALILLQMIVQGSSAWMVINCLLLTALTVAQFIGSICFDYSSESVQSESRVENKLLRLVLLMGNVVLITLVQAQTYIHLASSILFLLLLWSKERSLMKNEAYRAIALRFYLWAASEHARLFLVAFFPAASRFPTAIAASLAVSQMLCALLTRCRGTVNCHELLAKEQRLKLAFTLLRYAHASAFDPEIEHFVATLIAGEAEEGEAAQLKAEGTQRFPHALSRAVLSLLSKCDGFLEALLRAEVQAESGRVLVAAEELAAVRMRLERGDWLKRAMLIHAEQRLAFCFNSAASAVTLAHEEAWAAFLGFQELLHKAASQHLRLCLYLRKPEIELAKVKQICARILAIDAEAALRFDEVRTGFAASTELFVAFLARVRGDFARAEAVLSRQRLREKQLFDGRLDEKLFLRLRLESDGLTVDRVGFNARALLGFDRSDLESRSVESFVPPFFRAQHKAVTAAFLHGPVERTLLFQKQTVIRNGRGSYNACGIALKLGLSAEGFCFEGHVRVGATEQHNFEAFLSVDEGGTVLQYSEGLFEEDPQRSSIKVEQFFEGAVGETLTRSTNKYIYQRFDAMLVFRLQSSSIYFYAKNMENSIFQTSPQLNNNQQPNEQSLCIEEQLNSSFNLPAIEETIYSKGLLFITLLFLLLICGLFGCSLLVISSAKVKFTHQKSVIEYGSYIMQYYNNTFKLGMDVIYLDLRDNFNYSNTFWPLSLVQTSLRLQSISEYLKTTNQGKYTMPTPTTTITFAQSNYELIAMLTSNTYLYQQFQGDAFLRKSALDNMRAFFPTLYLGSLLDYRLSLTSLFSNYVQKDKFYDLLALGVSLANILLFLLVAIVLLFKFKAIEENMLELRCSTPVPPRKIQQIFIFLKMITLEEIGMQRMEDNKDRVDQFDHQNDNSFAKSEISLVKGATGRELVTDTLNQTGFLQQINRECNMAHEQEQKLIQTKSYGRPLLLFVILVAVLFALLLGNELQNNMIKDINEVTSLNTIIILYRISAYYSRAIIHTFNTMLLKGLAGIDNSQFYYTQIASYNSYLLTFTYPAFFEVQFTEFGTFTAKLKQLYQQSVCNFMHCGDQFNQQLNVNYVTLVNHMSANLSQLVAKAHLMDSASFPAFFSSPQTVNYMDAIFESEQLLRNYIIELSMVYLDIYVSFMNNLLQNKLTFAFSMIGVAFLVLVLFLWSVRFFTKEQSLLLHLVKLYQSPSMQ